MKKKTDIIQDILGLNDEPLISRENDKLFNEILRITRTSDFTLMNLSEDKLDELYSMLVAQEDFVDEVSNVPRNLSDTPSIILIDNMVDFI